LSSRFMNFIFTNSYKAFEVVLPIKKSNLCPGNSLGLET
jgi:hypothetical protein